MINTFEIIALELAPDRHRTIAGFMFAVLFALGIAAVAGWSFVIRDWPLLQIVLGLHSGLLLLSWWYVIGNFTLNLFQIFHFYFKKGRRITAVARLSRPLQRGRGDRAEAVENERKKRADPAARIHCRTAPNRSEQRRQ